MAMAPGVGAGAGAVAPPAAGAGGEMIAIIAWYRGEFAAANAIIDALCSHLAQINGGREGYEAAFTAIHRRRMNWIPVLHMQKYFSIADVTAELRRAAEVRHIPAGEAEKAREEEKKDPAEETGVEDARVSLVEGMEVEEDGELPKEVDGDGIESTARTSQYSNGTDEDSSGDSSDHQKLLEETDAAGDADDEGFKGKQSTRGNIQICSDHEACLERTDRIKISKGFVAKEPVKGHMVNVVKGLKLYEEIFTDSELLKLSEFINDLRLAGRRGDLSGETFIFFNKEMKGNKREIIQLGVPLFQSTKEELASQFQKSSIEPIPSILQSVINHLVQWRFMPEAKKPNSCIINFFDEDEHSQPYFKPPHLDNPICTLLLSETTMTFGRVLVTDHHGNYKGSLTLPLKEGSLLVMRGNSADMARHVICPSSNRRVSITFVKVRSPNIQVDHIPSPTTTAMTLWQPEVSLQQKVSAGVFGYGPQGMIPTWGLAPLRAPVVLLPPPRQMPMSPPGRRVSRGGTGVFLPWAAGPKKYTKHLPPRIQKRRLPALPLPIEAGRMPPIHEIMV